MNAAAPTVNARTDSRTVAAALAFAAGRLSEQRSIEFDTHSEIRSEARALVRLAAGFSDADVYANPGAELDMRAMQRLLAIVQRRSTGEPLAYIEGKCGFHALELDVDRNVLVPRPETELIVEAVLNCGLSDGFTVADLGAGSGAIALAIAYARADARIVGTDISAGALAVARANGRRLGLDIEWIESDWFSRLAERRFDVICCNPPYVCSNDRHLELLQHEPQLALDGGHDGLREIRRVLSGCAAHLNPDGRVLLEHGYDQSAGVSRLGAAAGLRQSATLSDLAGHQRVSIFRVPR